MLEGLGICQGLLWLLQAIVLWAKLQILQKGGRHHSPDKVGWVVPCNCWTLQWWHNMPVSSERTIIPITLSGRYPFGPGCLPVWATRWALQPALLTMQPSHGYWQRRVWAGAPAWQDHLPLQAVTSLWSWAWGFSLHWSLNCLPWKWPTSWVTWGWVSPSIYWLLPHCGLLMVESVLGDWPVVAFYGSFNSLGVLSVSYFLTAGDCLIAPSYHSTHERQNGSATLWPSSMATMASTWQWASLATLRVSFWESCLSQKWLKWSQVTCVWAWNSVWAGILVVLVPADFPSAPLAEQDPTYTGGMPSASPISLWGSLLLYPQNKVLLPAFFSADILGGIKPWSLPVWIHVSTAPWQEPLPGHLLLARAANGPGGFPSHILFIQKPLQEQTFSGREKCGGAHWVPTWGSHLGIVWHPVSFPPL